MGQRAVTVDTNDYLLPAPVRDAYLGDIQDMLDQAVVGSVAAMPGVVDAVTTKVATLTSDSAVGGLLDSATATRGKLDSRFKSETLVQVTTSTGVDVTSAVQAALNAGNDVVIVGPGSGLGVAKTTATLIMNASAVGQRLETRNAYIAPAFVGDAVQVTTTSRAKVEVRGNLQPSSGDYSQVAGIRIGGTSSNYQPQQASVAESIVRNFKGTGIIWAGGGLIDFTHAYISDTTIDGIRGIAGLDTNHGMFHGTHVIRAAGKGYAFYGAGQDLANNSSRHHTFMGAKAFQCGQNFYIESRSCVGYVFSELSGNPDQTTSTSRGNKLGVIETAAAYESWDDDGVGNEISGFDQNNQWSTKKKIIRQPQLGALAFSSITGGQYTVSTRTIAANSSADIVPGVNGLGTGRTVRATFFTSAGAGIIVNPWIDASGGLHFEVHNNTGSSKTVSGVISYEIWRFA